MYRFTEEGKDIYRVTEEKNIYKYFLRNVSLRLMLLNISPDYAHRAYVDVCLLQS